MLFFLPKTQKTTTSFVILENPKIQHSFFNFGFPTHRAAVCLLGNTFGSGAKFWSGQKFKNFWFGDFLLFHQVEHNIFTGWLRWAVPVSKIVVRHKKNLDFIYFILSPYYESTISVLGLVKPRFHWFSDKSLLRTHHFGTRVGRAQI